MNEAGVSLDKFIIDSNPDLELIIKILKSVKEIVLYLSCEGVIHGDISLTNILVDEKDNYHVRLGDVTSMIFPGDKKYHIKFLHEYWYNYYKDITVIDKLAYDLVTYLIINNYGNTLNTICAEPNFNFNDVLKLVDLEHNKDRFSLKISAALIDNIICNNKDKSLKYRNTYLIDCLK